VARPKADHQLFDTYLMARINGDIIFIDGSGQVRALFGDLTLRANESGGGHIIVGSGISLRPENNCNASDAIDLGQLDHRWKTLFACSGNFLDRPTVNGSGVLLQGEAGGAAAGVDSIEGLTGVVDLDSPDGTVLINVNGQIIELTVTNPTTACASGTFTPTSGTQFILEHALDTEIFTWNIWRTDIAPIQSIIPINVAPSGNDHAIVELATPGTGVVVFACGGPQGTPGISGTPGEKGEQGGVIAGVDSIEGLSGVIDLNSPDGTVLINVNGQIIELTVLPDAGQTSVEGISGVIDLDSPDGTILININGQTLELIVLPDAGQTSVEGISGVVDLDSPDESININVNAQAIELTTPSGYAPSGASYILVDYNDNDHLVDARKLSATSGIILDDQGARSGSGMVIKLDFDDEPAVGEVLAWQGQKVEWITVSSTPDNFDDAEELTDATVSASANVFEEFLSLATATIPTGRYRIGWHAVYNYDSVQRDPRMRIQLDGANLVEETRMELADAGSDQRIHVAGFVYTTFGSETTHTIDMDFARTNSGDVFTIFEGRIEIWRVSI